MNTHPYLRAYMAGTFVPTIVVMLAVCSFAFVRYVCGVVPAFPVERFMIFPLAFVPSLWGVWNLLYVALKRRLPIGVHGTLLVVLLAPLGLTVGRLIGLYSLHANGFVSPQGAQLPYTVVVIGAAGGLIIYYLMWKYVVGFLNRMLGIA